MISSIIRNDDVLIYCCVIYCCVNQGGSKIQEAYLIFQDLSEKYPMTGLILNGKAICCIHMGNFDEAETLLLEAQKQGEFETMIPLTSAEIMTGNSMFSLSVTLTNTFCL